jgi:hypothetical protein
MINSGSLIAEQFYLAEINLGTVGTNQTYPFADIPTLRYGSVQIECIKVWDADQFSKSPAGNTIIASTEIPGITLTLCVADQEQSIYYLPLYDLCSPLNGGLERLFKNLQVNLVKSFLTVTNSAIVTAGHSVVLGFYFKPTGSGPSAPIKYPQA